MTTNQRDIELFKESLKDTSYVAVETNGIGAGNIILQVRRSFRGTYDVVSNSGVEDFTLEGQLKKFINMEYATRRRHNVVIKRNNDDALNIISILKRLIREERFKQILD